MKRHNRQITRCGRESSPMQAASEISRLLRLVRVPREHVDNLHGSALDVEPNACAPGEFVLPLIVFDAVANNRCELALELVALGVGLIRGLRESVPGISGRALLGGDDVAPSSCGLTRDMLDSELR